MSWLRLLPLFMLTFTLAGDKLLSGAHAQETFPQSELWIETSSASHHFSVEIADTPARRAQGLMFREAMPVDHGMLFDFGKTAPVAMWMRNTFIPLDMLFIRADGTIHHIIVAAEPHTDTTRPSNGEVLAALELNGHVSELLGIRVGDIVHHAMFGNEHKPAD